MSNVDSDDLLTVDRVRAAGGDPRSLRLAAQRGETVRLRRGVYCLSSRWSELSDRERHVLRVHAVLTTIRSPGIVAGLSAAAVWDVPVPHGWTSDVCILGEYRGGGASEPGIRYTSAAASGTGFEVVGGVPVTSLERTAVDLARELPFASALGSVDAIVARGFAVERIRRELDRMTLRTGRAKVERVLEHATGVSGSFGESEARGAIIELGFEPPEVQVRFVDSQGEMWSDYFWRSCNIAGEFDGKVKFTRAEFSRSDPAEVAWREKKREDRLRRQVSGVVRVLTEHVHDRPALARMLRDAGIPRLGSRNHIRPQGPLRAAGFGVGDGSTTGRRGGR